MAPRAKRTAEAGTGRVRTLCTVFTVAAVVLWNELTRRGAVSGAAPLWSYAVAVGIVADVLMIAALAFTLWARVVLAGNWSARLELKQGHELVTRGPYRYARHPIYTGMLVMIAATAVYTGSVAWLIVLVGAFCFVLAESRLEEGLMMRVFPNEYPAYRARVKRLVPFVF
ncbi:MAG TPA: isoprenylcysteine carboxylmethyltransferase family protein [Gemmatimonadaceae bacterium]|nr:isoprenylcysteine carboxylmethyltransferase family protein [Gemmatimonadaceae bacterium]